VALVWELTHAFLLVFSRSLISHSNHALINQKNNAIGTVRKKKAKETKAIVASVHFA
jgi:hypothetical protein